jgi:hypothetical protein
MTTADTQNASAGTRILGPRVVWAAVFLSVLAAVTSVTIFCTVCTDFWSYDDMGFLMLTQKTLAAGHALYDQTFSAYGPAYYAWEQLLRTVTRLPLTHDSVLLVTTCAIMATSLLCAAYVARLGRNLLLSALTLLAASTLLLAMKSEPGHPQELCVLLLTGLLCGAACMDWIRRPAALLVLAGVCVGLLSMTKPNLGVFAALAVTLTVLRLAPAGKAKHLLFGLSALAALALPVILMRHHLPTIVGYCAVQSVAILLLVLQLAAWRPVDLIPWRAFAAGIAGFAAALLASAAYAFATGTSLAGLARGLFLQHLAFDQLFSFSSPFTNRDVLLPLIVAAGAWAITGPGRHRCTACPRLPSAVKAAVAPFMIVAVLKLGITQAFIWCLPLVAATAGPAARQPEATREMGARYLGVAVAVMNGLWGYPIWGSQAGLSFFLLIPLAMLSCADAVRYGMWYVGKSPEAGRAPSAATAAPAGPLRGDRTITAALSLAAMLVVLGLALIQASQAVSAYRQLEPSGLPGSRLLHLPIEQSDFYRRVIQSARAHGRTFFTMPGLHSFYFWADVAPPTAINATTWMTLLTPEQQSKVIADLERTPDLCVIRWNPMIDFWIRGRDISGNRVVRYIEDNFVTAETFNECDIMVRKPAKGP